ncbi:MAG TPA: hypothetical protein VN693_00800 [Rhodanobacteraceae bacterium]|nr:hypothetical protein [Rhodanobacteraceae bacterium]
MQPFVNFVFPQHVSVANPPSGLASEFPELVIAQDQAEARLPYSGQEELAMLLTRLQSLAIPFVAAGPGWHPELLPVSQTLGLGVMMKPEVVNGNETDVQSGVQA